MKKSFGCHGISKGFLTDLKNIFTEFSNKISFSIKKIN